MAEQTLSRPTTGGARRLDGRVAIVTGAAKGIGAAIVNAMTAEGARVVGVDVSPQAAVELDGYMAVTADITDPGRVAAIVDEAVARFGHIDILVNNAGIMDRFLPAGEVTDEVWRNVLAVNLTAPLLLIRAVLPHMVAAGGGAIVNIASIGGLAGGRAGAAYTASKHGLVGLTRSVAAAYASDKVRCNAVAPGAVDTGISIGGEPSARGYATLEKTLATNPGRARPDAIARVVAFLASDDASFVNGAVVVADGGWTAF